MKSNSLQSYRNIFVTQNNSNSQYFSNILEPLNYHVQSERELKEYPKFAKVAICLKGEQYKNGFAQRTVEVQNLKEVLKEYSNAENCYITSNQFVFGRSEAKLCNLVMLSCDLDTYKTEMYKNTTHEKLIKDVTAVCVENNLPLPTIMYSGNGYYLKWIFSEKVKAFKVSKESRAMLKAPTTVESWKIAQRVINKLFTEFGSDTKCLDVARLLRLCGTINLKTGNRAKLLKVNDNHSFDYMLKVLEQHTTQEDLDEVLPRQKKPKLKIAKEIKPPKKTKSEKLALIQSNEIAKKEANPNFVAKNTRTLARARYEDLLKLIEMRGDIVGERMSFVFWICNFMSVVEKMNYAEFEDQAKKVGDKIFKDANWSLGDLSTLENRLKEYNLKTVIKSGEKSYIPLYTPKNTTLISIFNITDDEQMQLKTIISADETKRRDRERKSTIRRNKGMKEQEGDKDTQPWLALGISRRTYYTRKKNGLL
ncbi:hypothetical protein [Pseudomonas helleri]|uniref:RepB-like DNA primase domain-containing protein n=1 Tax=Pseudomonas helleri TaxID=1608996 RepID=A0A7X2CIV1_9PSED|nr:hypothetical protein [Pseudomonas helleri]MQT93465.1 hypothetical protein [Pseudomonas helleri]MQU33200.1 hypothetical protein [Pseudomonas helleri]